MFVQNIVSHDPFSVWHGGSERGCLIKSVYDRGAVRQLVTRDIGWAGVLDVEEITARTLNRLWGRHRHLRSAVRTYFLFSPASGDVRPWN